MTALGLPASEADMHAHSWHCNHALSCSPLGINMFFRGLAFSYAEAKCVVLCPRSKPRTPNFKSELNRPKVLFDVFVVYVKATM